MKTRLKVLRGTLKNHYHVLTSQGIEIKYLCYFGKNDVYLWNEQLENYCLDNNIKMY